MIRRIVASTGAIIVFLGVIIGGASATTLTVDQVGAPFRNGGYTGGQVFQSFTPTASNIAGIDVDFYIFLGPKDLTVRLWDTAALTGNLLLDLTNEVAAPCGSNDLACQEFRFSPIAINPNEVLFMEFAWTGSGAIGAARTTTQNYPGGEIFCLQNCGNTADGDVAFVTYSSVVPVPGALWLLVSALGGLGWIRHKANEKFKP